MPQIRRLGATTAIVAVLLFAFTAVTAGHPDPHRFGPRSFDNVWVGTPEADQYVAPEDSRDKVLGRGGNDVLDGGNRRDVVKGDQGNDALDGGDASDRVYGGPGNDRIAGGNGPDLISGGFGADGIDGGRGHDLIKAGPGADIIIATDGMRDWIVCGRGKDAVRADRVDRVHRSCERVIRVPFVPAD